MDFLDSHRPYRPDCNGKDLPPKVASTGCTSAMSELAAFGLHSTWLSEEVSRPFLLNGTVRLLTLIPAFYDAMFNEKTVFVDEIENSMPSTTQSR